jgi:hypothetical protein
VDAFGCSLFDLAPRDLPYLALARERGLGEYDLGKVRVEKRKI